MLQKLYLHLVILEFIFYSGSVRFFLTDQKSSMIVLLITALVGFFINRTKLTNVLKYNFKIFCPILIWIIINVFVIGNNIRNFSYLLYIIYPLSCFIIMSYVDHIRFKKVLFYYMYVLTIVSIFVQLLHDYWGMSGSTYMVADKMYTMNFNLFNTAWGENRLSSIFWEPGQFQVVIFYFLCLYINEIRNTRDWKVMLLKYGVFVIAIMMTKSTTGYIVLGLFMTYIFVFNKNHKSSIKTVTSILMCIALIYTIYSSDDIQNKLINIQDAESHTSAAIRLNDNLSCLQLAIENPIMGAGIADSNTLRTLERYGNITSSNGWLYVAACFGFLYLFYILFYFYKGIKRLNLGKYPIIVFCILFITQCNEGYIMLPYMWMYIFKFRSVSYHFSVGSFKI